MFWLLLALVAFGPFLRERMRKPMDRSARNTAPGRFAMLSRGQTHFDWYGPPRAPVAVCVHGLTTPSFVWKGVVRHLVKMGFRVLVYDLYGRGYSDRPRGPQNVEFFRTQLEELLALEGVSEEITLIGYSMGGPIVSSFAASHPDRLRRLILLAPAGMGHDLGGLAKFAAEWPVIGDWLMHAFYPRFHRKATEAERDMPSSVEGIVDLQQRELKYRGFIRSVLASLRGTLRQSMQSEHRVIAETGLPVAAIWAREDTVILLRGLGQLTEWNRTVHQEVIEEAGHGLAYTHTDEVAACLRRIMKDEPVA